MSAAERCQWEVPENEDQQCQKRAVWPANDWLGVYCREHLAIWRAEIERRNERDKAAKLSPEISAWYRRMAARS